MAHDLARRLIGSPAPEVTLRATSGGAVALDRLGPGRTVVDVDPLSARPGAALPEGWDTIPGPGAARPTHRIRDGAIEHVFFPVDAPGEHAEEVLAWWRGRAPAAGR